MKMRNSFTLSTIVVGLVASQMALAQGVGNLGSLPGPIIPMNGPGGWSIGNPAAPVAIQLNPNGPVWLKQLADPNGGPLVVNNPNTTFGLHETIQIAPNLPWSDWHEDILTPGWTWSNISFTIFPTFTPPPGLNITNTPGNLTQGDFLDFTFNSLPVGTIIDIRKDLTWVGTPGVVGFNGTIDIAQYPTPEPASLLMLTLGSVIALKRRRSRLA